MSDLKEFKKILNIESKDYFLQLNREFTVDNDNREFLHKISLYCTNNLEFEKGDGQLQKGLLILGNCGTGKSSIFDIIQNISKKHKISELWYKNVSVNEIVSKFEKEGEYVVQYHQKGCIHFDDLGTEKLANSWGVKENLMARIFELRYENFKAYGLKTHVTTNLTKYELHKKYGDRVMDRFFEMFNFLELEGDSRRF
ncbi:hypothetical protein [Wenyingzhuangia sp. 2_MG-2023]|uniref:hypothetical protein n=1 Tax=Wenyingzhuangia sp. 2_MG-2023 TaxID=3062639 RepID=UPI0026E3154B|nr:hypothetical protein [Wenyingzhuangia sp. 2_MG-2023]MDO6737384.1 hypothetical protein [Wenyingzhuangia sp. 2_MG-2023]